jgi:hypothetical protein
MRVQRNRVRLTMTYRLSSRPGEEFRARYQSGTWRVAAERVGAGPAEGIVLNDWLTGLALQIWRDRREYRIVDAASAGGSPGLRRLGTLTADPEARFINEGEDTIAGLICTRWRIESRAHATERVCVTADGVPLRRQDDAGIMEATDVRYAWTLPPHVALPYGFRRLDAPAGR